jgi:hypothetical protein
VGGCGGAFVLARARAHAGARPTQPPADQPLSAMTDQRELPRGFISADEWRWVWAVTAGVLIVASLPYVYAYAATPDGWQYMGILVNVPDHAQYFSWFRQYLTADLASNTLTPEPNAPIFFNLLWWLLAKAGALLSWDYAAMFQMLRVTATAAFLLMLYRLCAWFLVERLQRQVAFLTAVFASGFGWLLIVGKYLFGWDYPLEINLLIFIVEPNSFYAMLATPHLVGAALYMFAFDLVLRGEVKGQLRYAVAAGLWTLFLGFQHAYDLFLVYGILGAYGLLKTARDRRLPWFLVWSGLILGALSAWPGLYSALLTSLDPIWRDVLAQFDNAGVFTPNPLLLPVLMGPAFLLALFMLFKDGVFRLHGVADDALFLKAWFWANLLLVYLPTNYQIKMLNGWQVPIAILATQGLFRYVLPWAEAGVKARRWSFHRLSLTLAAGLLVVAAPTNLYLYAWRFLDLSRHTYPYYLRTDETAALGWLAAQVQPGDVVLASLTVGQYVPALTGAHAYLAHWAQTVDYYGKTAMVVKFFDGATSDADRQAILRQYGVDYVFYGPAERALGGYDPSRTLFLRPAYADGAVTVYQVR